MAVMTPPGIKVPGDYIEQVMISVKAKNPPSRSSIRRCGKCWIP